MLIAPEDHPLAGRNTATAEEIAAHPFITHTSAGHVGQLVAVLMRMHGIAPKVVVEVDGWDVITRYVAAGAGISFVPDLCLSGREPVSEVPFSRAAPPRRYGAITRRSGPLSLAASQCLRIMAPERLEASGEP